MDFFDFFVGPGPTLSEIRASVDDVFETEVAFVRSHEESATVAAGVWAITYELQGDAAWWIDIYGIPGTIEIEHRRRIAGQLAEALDAAVFIADDRSPHPEMLEEFSAGQARPYVVDGHDLDEHGTFTRRPTEPVDPSEDNAPTTLRAWHLGRRNFFAALGGLPAVILVVIGLAGLVAGQWAPAGFGLAAGFAAALVTRRVLGRGWVELDNINGRLAVATFFGVTRVVLDYTWTLGPRRRLRRYMPLYLKRGPRRVTLYSLSPQFDLWGPRCGDFDDLVESLGRWVGNER